MINKFLASKFFYILTSVFFAIILFFNASSTSIRNQGSNTAVGEVYTSTVTGVPVNLKYDTSKYFVSGSNNTARVQLSASNRIPVANEENPDTRTFFLSVDLSDVKTGTVDLPIRIEQLPNGVTATIEPKRLSVTVEEKATQEFVTSVNIDPAQVPAGYKITSTDLSVDKVEVTAGKNSIKNIKAIEASLPNDVTLTEDYSGTVTLHAVDSNGKVLPAQIKTTTAHLKVNIQKPSKRVPINFKMTGKLDDSLSEMKTSLSANTVIIYGKPSDLEKIDKIDAPLDITGIKTVMNKEIGLGGQGVEVNPGKITVTLTPVKKAGSEREK